MVNQCSSPYVDNCAHSFLSFPFFLSFLYFFFVFVRYVVIVCLYVYNNGL